MYSEDVESILSGVAGEDDASEIDSGAALYAHSSGGGGDCQWRVAKCYLDERGMVALPTRTRTVSIGSTAPL